MKIVKTDMVRGVPALFFFLIEGIWPKSEIKFLKVQKCSDFGGF